MTCRNYSRSFLLIPVALICMISACDTSIIMASLGGDVPGGRGSLEVIFDNQTAYRAIFTVGVYDPQDKTSSPQYVQFAVDPTQDQTQFNRGLQPGEVTPRGSFVVNCGRVVSLGGEQMIERIESADVQPINAAPVIQDALRPGISFTAAPIDDPDANGVENPALHSDPVESVLGADYQCDALLIYRFIPDSTQPDGVRITLDVIATDDTEAQE